MRLKTLELQGFKSFPDKTLISFDRGITVVVGPNGSGKSNIADAMRWVLGEMSSKNIRGGKMEDVVFAGSQKRSPMGYAEVSVTFDNSEEGGKIQSLSEYDEITVTRRYYRVGDSEYFINRKPVRLRDIHELFFNTGLGRDGYSIIGQGKIAEIISQKNDERRAIFEEAAGIAKYRFQKNEAERKLSNTDENLIRLEDIVSVLGERVGPLEKESEKAKKYLDLRDKKMALDIALSVFDVQAAKAVVDDLSGKLLLAKSDLDRADETRAAIEAAEEKAREEDMENKLMSERLSEQVLSLTSALHDAEAKKRLAENDKEHLKASLAAEKERVKASLENMALSERETENFKKEEAKANEQKAILLKKAEETEALLERSEGDLSINAGLTAAAEASISELRAKQTDAAIEASAFAAKNEADRKRLGEIALSVGRLEGDIALYQGRITAAEERLASYQQKERAVREKLDALALEKAEHEKRMGRTAEEKNQLFLDISQRKHKVQNLVRMEELLEGYSGAVRFLVNEHKAGRVRLADGRPVTVYGPVSGLVTVPEQYATALEIAFGGTLQNIVVEDEESAKASIAHLKKKNAGRATFYPVSTMRGTELAVGDVPERVRDGFVAVASTLVDCDEKFRGIVKSLVGRILIAKDIDSATRIAKAMNFRYRIVTLDGQVVNAGGSFTGGSVSQDGKMLSRRVQIEKLNEEIKTLEVSFKKAERSLETLVGEKESLRKKETELLSSASGIKTMHDAEQTQLAVLLSGKEGQEKSLAALKAELSGIENATALMETSLGDAEGRRSGFESELSSLEEKLAALRSERNRLNDDLEEAKDEQTRISVEFARLDSHLSMLSKMRETAEKRTEELCESVEALRLSIEASEKRLSEIAEQEEALRLSLERTSRELKAAEAEKKTAGERAMETEKRLNALRVQNRELSDRRDLLYRTFTRLESEHGTQREKQEKLIAFLWDEYELGFSDAVKRVGEPITKETRSAALIEQTKYKNAIKNLGNVNVGAIEEYKEVRGQFDDLTGQITDLKKSKESLLRIIDSLEENMRRDFISTVEAINIHFGRVFSQLFGGGHAEIRLADPDHVLESGIEIHVAPPGKVIKNMSLLSGGEQAFVAIALYFAILEVNPSPFCILDEIEAALDEVNVDKFADYVKKYSDKTQFVIITHRRGTMEAAERLYGVTMHEKGISDILSIDVSEIEQKIGVKFE